MKVTLLGRGETQAVQAFKSGHTPREQRPSLSLSLSIRPSQPSTDSGHQASHGRYHAKARRAGQNSS